MEIQEIFTLPINLYLKDDLGMAFTADARDWER